MAEKKTKLDKLSMSRNSYGEAIFLQNIPEKITYLRDYRFCKEWLLNHIGDEGVKKLGGIRKALKKYGLKDRQFDFYFPDINLGVEIQGGIYKNVGHSSGQGIQQDIHKIQDSWFMDYALIQVSTQDVNNESRLNLIMKKIIKLHESNTIILDNKQKND